MPFHLHSLHTFQNFLLKSGHSVETSVPSLLPFYDRVAGEHACRAHPLWRAASAGGRVLPATCHGAHPPQPATPPTSSAPPAGRPRAPCCSPSAFTRCPSSRTWPLPVVLQGCWEHPFLGRAIPDTPRSLHVCRTLVPLDSSPVSPPVLGAPKRTVTAVSPRPRSPPQPSVRDDLMDTWAGPLLSSLLESLCVSSLG